MNGLEIIAEVGVNHDGDFEKAVSLLHSARNAGATTVKFQLWNTEHVYPRERWDEMKQLELTRDQIRELRDIAILDGLRFLCTPDTYDDAVFLKQIGCDRLKVGSSNLTNERLLRALAELGLPIILSTGASEWHEVHRAVYTLRRVPLTIMHCVSSYPAPEDQHNLAVIRLYHKRFRRPVGFSDHTLANARVALVAMGMGARTFEKHITYDKQADGPDHGASLDLVQFSSYVRDLRVGAATLGTGVKTLMPCEVENRAEYDRFVRQQMERSCAPS